MTQQHPDRHSDCRSELPAGTVSGSLPGLRDPRPGRLRQAIAARAEAKSGLIARRAERLARIRAGIAALAEDAGTSGLPEPPSAPLREEAATLLLREEIALSPQADVAAPPLRAEIAEPLQRDETAEPPLRAKTATRPLRSDASPLRGGVPIPREESGRDEMLGAADEAERNSVRDPERDLERDVEALECFLAGLVGALDIEPVPQPTRLAPAVIALRPHQGAAGPDGQRADGQGAGIPADDAAQVEGDPQDGAPADDGSLARLPGAGPGLVAALVRAGVPDLAALAGLEPETLADRLGPIGRLIDLRTWIALARAETAREAACEEAAGAA
jgi:hypothetical protein